MSMPSADHTIRKRAIATGLTPFMDESQIAVALRHWEQHYAEKPSLALQYFVADITITQKLDVSRATLLRSLIRAMGLPPAELVNLPGTKVAPAPTSEPAPDKSSQAFALLLGNIVAQLDNEMQHKLRLAFFAELRSQHLPAPVLNALQSWLGQQRPLKLGQAPKGMLQKLVTEFYILLCRHLGPTEADVLLAKGLQMARQAHPELDAELSRII